MKNRVTMRWCRQEEGTGRESARARVWGCVCVSASVFVRGESHPLPHSASIFARRGPSNYPLSQRSLRILHLGALSALCVCVCAFASLIPAYRAIREEPQPSSTRVRDTGRESVCTSPFPVPSCVERERHNEKEDQKKNKECTGVGRKRGTGEKWGTREGRQRSFACVQADRNTKRKPPPRKTHTQTRRKRFRCCRGRKW